jgi:predicted acyltransferase
MWGATLEELRLFGVLQRFAIAYFVITVLYIFLTRRSYGHPEVRLEYDMCLANKYFIE